MRYRFCRQLKNSIFFANNEIIHCCACSEDISPKFYTEYKGELFENERISEEKREAAGRAKKGELPYKSCEHCHSYVEEDWDNDFSIKDISISHWTACNCNCVYCYTAKDKKYFNTRQPYKLLPVLEKIRDCIDFTGTVRFIGGDIAMLEEFDEIVDFFVKNGCKNFYIPTSGIQYKETVENILLKGYGHVIVSPDSGNREMYKKIKQTDSFNIVKNNMQKYLKAAKEGNCIFEVKYVFIPQINDTVEEINNWLVMCKDMGVKNIALDFETNYLTNNPKNIPPHIMELVNLVEKTAEEKQMELCKFTYLTQLIYGLTRGLYSYGKE